MAGLAVVVVETALVERVVDVELGVAEVLDLGGGEEPAGVAGAKPN